MPNEIQNVEDLYEYDESAGNHEVENKVSPSHSVDSHDDAAFTRLKTTAKLKNHSKAPKSKYVANQSAYVGSHDKDGAIDAASN